MKGENNYVSKFLTADELSRELESAGHSQEWVTASACQTAVSLHMSSVMCVSVCVGGCGCGCAYMYLTSATCIRTPLLLDQRMG